MCARARACSMAEPTIVCVCDLTIIPVIVKVYAHGLLDVQLQWELNDDRWVPFESLKLSGECAYCKVKGICVKKFIMFYDFNFLLCYVYHIVCIEYVHFAFPFSSVNVLKSSWKHNRHVVYYVHVIIYNWSARKLDWMMSDDNDVTKRAKLQLINSLTFPVVRHIA